ncbi:TonB-dependent receptor [Arcicella sp. LKC2W]|uniref:TonB-dependent receptor n=1 Tax=Arcicella sp. LKC2W TaxID=2984198 RepID=UPI002B211D6C|nr:TonB-dependent receptor [Arcicella sp. LKC2W]MEA5460998.1 TonB-dependent receptor [Arcicella sp. LKC2W]
MNTLLLLKKNGICLLLILCSHIIFAQNNKISGKVTDTKGEALAGASVTIKGANKGSLTDKNGDFSIANVNNGTVKLSISFIGFTTKEVNVTVPQTADLSVTLSDDETSLEEVVVTGVFDKRTKMSASVAISTLNVKQIEAVVPNSSADLLKNLPGVYVNTSRGEVGNSIYTRGLNYNGGFFYVSMQEDGLPVMGISGLIQPDAYLRADATINKIESVRGGTASILGPNAPGGIFNYVSKTGGQTFAGEARARFGLEGNGKNPYYRADFNVGGPLSKDKTLTFNVGGFYRSADGPKYPGYKLSYGGQVKANIIKNYKSGSLKLYAKVLDDNTAQFEYTPSVDFQNPRPAGSFTNTSSTLIQSQQFTVLKAVSGASKDINYDTQKVGSYDEKSIGLNWEQTFGEGWTFNNNLKYSDKDNISQTTAVVFPFRVDQVVFYGVSGNVAKFGTYEFYNPTTGQSYGTVQQLPPTPTSGGIRFIPNNLSLPGGDVLQNAVFYNPNPYGEVSMNDFIDQATISKKLKNMTFTGGLYYASTKANRFSMIPAGQSFATVENQPKTVAIRYTSLAGTKFELTNPNGITNFGGSGVYENEANIKQTALFLGHNWDITEKLNFDWGIRAETFNIKSSFVTPKRVTPDSPTGADGNATTLYDNRLFTANPTQSFEKTLSFSDVISYSMGLNYKIHDGLAVYGRYSQGRKTPDLSYFMDIANQQLTSNISVEAQDIKMAEFGVKYRSRNFNLFLTPFYTLAGNIPNFQIFQNTDATYYAPARVYQKIETKGLELEGNYVFNKNFSLRVVGILQSSVAKEFSVWLAKTNGPADDEKVSYNGNQNDNIGNMFTVTPTYSNDKFTASINWQYMGKRWANVGNAFQLPSFNSFDLNTSYKITNKVQANLSINNLFDTYGIMGWAAPGGFPAALDTQGFTKAMLDANPQAIYATLPIMPRAYFLTLSYKF